LFTYAEKAQARLLVKEEHSGVHNPSISKKRYREDTPPKELESDREKRYKLRNKGTESGPA